MDDWYTLPLTKRVYDESHTVYEAWLRPVQDDEEDLIEESILLRDRYH